MTTVTITPYIDPVRNKHVVYATLRDEFGNALTGFGASLDYCISYAEDQGFVVANAQEVLSWLHRNVEFTP